MAVAILARSSKVTQRVGTRKHRLELGFVSVAFALGLVVLLGSAGLALDIGRMYITRSEAQSYCDSAAIAAALKLNGTAPGIASARTAALAVVKGWQFGTRAFDPARTVVEFGQTPDGPFDSNPANPTGYTSARVSTRVDLSMYLLPVAVGSLSSSIAASATAMQVTVGTPGAGHFAPFSPFGAPIMNPEGARPVITNWNDPFNMTGAEVKTPAGITYQEGLRYNILWPNNNQIANDPDGKGKGQITVCGGGQHPSLISLKTTISTETEDALKNSNRGYLYNQSTLVAETILGGVIPEGYPLIDTGMTVYDDFLAVSSGAMHNNIINGLEDRVNTDSDSTSKTYQEYVELDKGNGRRVVVMPINAGPCGPTTFDAKNDTWDYSGTNTCTFPVGDGTKNIVQYDDYQVVGWGRFFLLADHYDHLQGQEGACAEYIGPGFLEGTNNGGGRFPYVVRLVR